MLIVNSKSAVILMYFIKFFKNTKIHLCYLSLGKGQQSVYKPWLCFVYISLPVWNHDHRNFEESFTLTFACRMSLHTYRMTFVSFILFKGTVWIPSFSFAKSTVNLVHLLEDVEEILNIQKYHWTNRKCLLLEYWLGKM